MNTTVNNNTNNATNDNLSYLSDRVNSIKESPTFAIIALANKMKLDKKDVIVLAAGEPDFDTPQSIKEAAIIAINEGKTKYTPVAGITELRQAIKNKFYNENNLNYAINEILVCNGGKQAIFNAMQALLNDGDEVIIPAPFWVSYPDMVILSGGIPKIIQCNQDTEFKITPKKLQDAINARTKMIILNSPNNPTGMVYSDDELLALAAILRLHPNIYIVSDDIYEHIIFNTNSFQNIINVAPDLQSRTIVVNGVSKAYSMTGWRIGYAAISNSHIIKAMEKVQSQSTSNPCSISQYAALKALTDNKNDEYIKNMQNSFLKRSYYIKNAINSIEGFKCLDIQGAFYAFFDCSDIIKKLYSTNKISMPTDLELARFFLEEALVAMVPGSAFGLENYMRISFATSIDELEMALTRIKNLLI